MRSLSTRLFSAILLVAVVSLAIGAWWVRRAIQLEFNREVTIQQRIVNGKSEEVVRDVTRDVTPPQAALNRRLLLGLAVVMLGAALATALVSQRILGPVRSLHRAADRWSRGDFAGCVDVKGHDELAALGRAFNSMAGRLDAQERLKRDLTNDIAHELRTPLTNLRCHIEALQDGVVPAGPETWTTIGADVASLERLVGDLGELAQAEARQLPMTPEAVDVRGVLESLLREVAPRAVAADISVSVEAAGSVPRAWVDRGRLQQVVRNLLDNALAHSPRGGFIRLAMAPHADGVVIRISDTGRGIDPAHLPHIFDRFYRADPSRSRTTGGAGLGLAIARHIVLASGGTIAVESTPGQGATFVVTLPAAPSQVLHNAAV